MIYKTVIGRIIRKEGFFYMKNQYEEKNYLTDLTKIKETIRLNQNKDFYYFFHKKNYLHTFLCNTICRNSGV